MIYFDNGATTFPKLEIIYKKTIDSMRNLEINSEKPRYHCKPLTHKTIGTEEIGAARFSFSYFNKEEEIYKALELLEKYAKEVN